MISSREIQMLNFLYEAVVLSVQLGLTQIITPSKLRTMHAAFQLPSTCTCLNYLIRIADRWRRRTRYPYNILVKGFLPIAEDMLVGTKEKRNAEKLPRTMKVTDVATCVLACFNQCHQALPLTPSPKPQ